MNYVVESFQLKNQEIDYTTREEYLLSSKPATVLTRFQEEFMAPTEPCKINHHIGMLEIILSDKIFFVEEAA